MKELLFELGCEEIPARFLRRAERDLGERVVAGLEAAGVVHEGLRTWSTPRRLALALRVADKQPDTSEVVTGPPKKVAYDADGKPTKAAIGFAKRQGVDVDALQVIDTERGEYLACKVETTGVPTRELLPALLKEACAGLHWPKPMRFGSHGQTFIRPVHWLLALLDGQTVPMTFCGVSSSAMTRGHRFHAPEPFEVSSADQWLEQLRLRKVEPDTAERERRVLEQARELATKAGGKLVEDPGLVEEVTGLVEWPVPLLGTFDKAFLELPGQVLVTSMKVHQKFFAVRKADGALVNHFVVVAGLESTEPDVVAAGNGRVLAARLSDARFFWESDTKKSLDQMGAKLGERTFLKGLGTMRDKAQRIERLAGKLAERLYGDAGSTTAAERAGWLAKADLSSDMVGEFPELQGEMGRDYARVAGEDEAVAVAIAEHYLPRHAGDDVPATPVGAAVALADRLDSIVGCFALGLEPTGSADPYALRRQALGVWRILEELPAGPSGEAARLTFSEGLDLAREVYDDVVKGDWEPVRASLLEFFRGRLKSELSQHHPTDLTEAVLASGFDDPVDARGRLQALHAAKETEGWDDLAIAVKRVARIVADQAEGELDPSKLVEPQEKVLYEAWQAARGPVGEALERGDYGAALDTLVSLKPQIDDFFDHVMVMSEDPSERELRLALLHGVAGLFHRVAAFDRIST